LCVILRQPPFFKWKIRRHFSSYVQGNTVYLQLVQWIP
jgi:hypothetical protein